MRTASCLTLLAIGAILSLAVTAHPRFLNLQVAGLVFMATGAAGLLLPHRASGWLRRRTILRRGRRGPVVSQVEETRYPPYVMLNPGATTPEPGDPTVGHEPGDLTAGQYAMENGFRPAATEVVEEYIQE